MKTASIFEGLEFSESKPMIKVLFETDFTKEIRIAMKKGVSMKKHQTSFPIVVELVDGKVDFGVNEELLNLKKGDILALVGGVPHDLLAQEDAIVRLTLTKSDETSRVQNVINS
jgi:quercetin dioxygenase-like cupin family protein